MRQVHFIFFIFIAPYTAATIELAANVERTITLTSNSSYTITAPPQHRIQAACKIFRGCFEIEPEFTNDRSTTERFCGNGTVTRYSLFNYLRIGSSGNGTVECMVKVFQAALCACGWGHQGKIVNGAEVFPHEFPSVASLLYKPARHFFCGGTIISPTFVLTAAHCFQIPAYRTSSVDVLVGFHKKYQQSRYSQTIPLKQVIIHEGYRAVDQSNDIALAVLAAPIWYTRGTGPACLPYNITNEFFYNRDVQMVGWGAVSYGGNMSTTYQKVALTVMPNEICEKKIIWVNEKKLCTFKENKDACQSDSGGPCYFLADRQMIVGIISFGIRCASATPGVNTSVMKYLDWIEQRVKSSNICYTGKPLII